MAITRIPSQDATGTSSATTSVSATYAVTPTLNNLLIAVVGDSDGLNNATAIAGWTLFNNISLGTNSDLSIFYKISTGAESTTVTATTTGGTTACMAIYEYSGLQTSSVADRTASGTNFSSATVSTGTTAATTVADELLMVAGCINGAGVTFSSWSNSFNLRNSLNSGTIFLFTGDRIVAATSAYTSTLTVGGSPTNMTGMIDTFKGLTVVPSGFNIALV